MALPVSSACWKRLVTISVSSGPKMWRAGKGAVRTGAPPSIASAIVVGDKLFHGQRRG